MPTEDFVKYITEAKGLFYIKYKKEIESIKIKEQNDKKVIFLIKGVGTKEFIEIEVLK